MSLSNGVVSLGDEGSESLCWEDEPVIKQSINHTICLNWEIYRNLFFFFLFFWD